MGVSDDNTVPSFMRNPGWEALQEEIRAGQQGKRAEDAARLDAIKTQLSAVVEIMSGVSALGTPASEEELFILRRKFHAPSFEWLIEKPLTADEVSTIISLRSELDEKPFLDKSAFISLTEVKEIERKRQEGQIEIIRRLMKASKISFSPKTELPETSSLGGKIDGEGTTFVLGGWFFGENPLYRRYFYGMIFNDAEKEQLVWLFDEVKPESFVSIVKLKEVLARKFAHGNGHESISTVGERLPGVEDVLLQGHPDRHAASPAPRREAKAKPSGRTRQVPRTDDDDEFAAAGGGRSRGRKK